MKKIQCEVCGSIDIQKISEEFFECQSCGVQYRAENVKNLLVEIKDILGTIEEKVAPPSAQNKPSESTLENHYVLESKISPQENVKHFLSYLDKAENISCDIYKELSIEQVKELYVPFYYVIGQYRVDWSAIACHTYYENETVYENRYNATLGRMVKEPVTKKVEKTQRTPQNGTQNCTCRGFVLASSNWEQELNIASNAEKQKLLQAFQSQQEQKILDGAKLEDFDSDQLRQEKSVFYYGNLKIDNDLQSDKAEEERSNLRERTLRITRSNAEKGLQGGHFENYSHSRSIISEQLAIVYVPTQVITYQYKGQLYVAVSDLSSTSRTIPTIYPCDKQLTSTQNNMEQEQTQAAGMSGLTKLGLFSLAIEVIALFVAAITDYTSGTFFMITTALCISLVLTLTGLIKDAVNRKRITQKHGTVFLDMLMPRKLALQNGKRVFFESYTNYASARSAAASTQYPALGDSDRKLFASVPLDYFDQDMESNQMLEQIIQLDKEVQALEKQKLIALIMMTVLGVLFIPLVIGSIIYGNSKNKLETKKAQLQSLKAEWMDS